ncbi:MAG: ABC transporter ATP-binding protein [Thermoplasmatota archaeon]
MPATTSNAATIPVVAARGVSKTYGAETPTARQALRGVTLALAPGDFCALMGPSGCGKSTLLNLMGALDRPTTGEISFGDTPLSTLGDRARSHFRSRFVGFVFQSYNLVPRISALQNVLMPTMFTSTPPAAAKARALSLLARMGLAHRATSPPNELSGGERQRVAIARSLINDPPLLLADEPTGNLDSESGASILELLRELNGEGKTLLLVTHDPAVAAKAKRTVRMFDGRFVEGGA